MVVAPGTVVGDDVDGSVVDWVLVVPREVVVRAIVVVVGPGGLVVVGMGTEAPPLSVDVDTSTPVSICRVAENKPDVGGVKATVTRQVEPEATSLPEHSLLSIRNGVAGALTPVTKRGTGRVFVAVIVIRCVESTGRQCRSRRDRAPARVCR